MAIEFWLIQDNDRFQLPVPPEEFSLTGGNDNQTVNVYKTGDLSLWGPKTLNTISLTSFFPNPISEERYQCSYGNPFDSVKLINKFRDSGKPIKLLITETDINMDCLIDKFEYGVSAGADVNFSLTLTQYKKIHIPKVADNNNLVVGGSEPNRPTPPTTNPPTNNNSSRTHTVSGNDTLWGIAKKYYGDGSKWGTIWDANKPMRSGNPNLIYTGEVVKIP